ncbi:HNH endonuclease [Streptomyces sp. HNM0663]|uniref:HNH endonuclease n=1 Tax=Streptomyces chengmaiensis TaxID=3040919 RepID=A0ABT6HH08_9ACTN|nr:HNH endonuclease [Streptomyces chengmaiensis]MDH2387631.1 HNH endonuclease [Streptomyces chengmaiensis]
MTEGRPDIPTGLRRAVLVEAGHRCAIPTCRQVPVEIAHITPWAKTKEHKFDNLIALCPTCHTRYDRGEMDRKSMLQYKQNLEVLNGRYTDVERQLLKVYAKLWAEIDEQHGRAHPGSSSLVSRLRQSLRGGGIALGQITVHNGMSWILSNLVDDGLVEVLPATGDPRNRESSGVHLTPKGFALIERLIAAEPI